MSDHIGIGYGSEFHLMRLLGRYRQELNARIEQKIGESIARWLDFKHEGSLTLPDPARKVSAATLSLPDEEYKGLAFLPPNVRLALMAPWQAFWPQSGSAQNCDAIAQTENGTWLLVEAKAHSEEMISSCKAVNASRAQIQKALAATQQAIGATPSSADAWLDDYYQFANRLAVLHFLKGQGIPAKLVFLYFCGDVNPNGKCPKSEMEWENLALDKERTQLGLTPQHIQNFGAYEVFVPLA